MHKILGIDLGGTSAKVGIVNEFGNIEHYFQVRNSENNLLSNLIKTIKNELKTRGCDFEREIEAIGFGCAGFINHKTGMVIGAYNLGWINFDLKKELIEKWFKNKRIFILNDANAAALGEFWTGAGNQSQNQIFYTLGTGIGGAIIIDNKLVTGENGYAGEFGHGGNYQNLFECSCGLKTCLEASTSAIGLSLSFKKYLNDNPNNAAWQFFNGEAINLKQIGEIYAKNNKPSVIRTIFVEILKPLISHMATMVFALDTKTIVICGGASEMGENLIEIIDEELKKSLLDFMRNSVSVKAAVLGNKVGIVGAAYYALTNNFSIKE